MTNEKKTENLVRKHFEKFPSLIVWEQQSDDLKINKLLKNASKKGDKQGRPEFIIAFKKYPNFLIIVECKGDVKKHESKSGDKYSEYAVDGALLYSSFLAKEFDVLALAVSGETLSEIKISHFLHLKGSSKALPIFSNKLLDPDSYYEGYIQSPEKFRQDYDELLDFARELNEELHHHKILENQRSLLISSILIALDHPPFRKAYPAIVEPDDLSNYLVDTVSNVLKKANINSKKIQNLDVQFSFIRADTSLSTKENVLRNLIDSIDNNINKFIKTHEYYDVLGQLYIEFLRYANSDKGLGIVLTPPHITEFFNDLAAVNKDSVVYDNCTGTGGFLISAMSKMIKDAKNDLASIKQIKEKQIVGVEFQSHIFALACSNMYIHKDGKTNIINGSCFDKKIIEQVKKYNPNVGLLNPPYKADKKKDIEELEFVLNNLEALQKGGVCVAILPMQCALATKGKVHELKKRILERHTLEAVLSMPDQLFFNSDVGTVTCIMVLTAHKPHLQSKETYFGYYKDDGFIKRKNKGRVDFFGKWDAIKAQWLEHFVNRKEKAGLSVNRIVTANDEWCAEAYMQTDYATLKEADFVYDIKKFVLFKKLNNLI